MKRALVGALVTGAVVVLTAAPASAHALLRSSDPVKGARLDDAPARITLTFTEPPDASLSSVRVLDSSGGEVQRGRARVAGERHVLWVDVRDLVNGVYTVSWRVVSRVDGHLTAGSFAFGVGVQPGITPQADQEPASPKPTPLSIAGRWALYAGLALLIGLAAAGLFILERAPVARSAAPAAWLVAAAGFVAMTSEQARAVGVPITSLLSSPTGTSSIRLAVALGISGLLAGAIAIAGRKPSLLVALGIGASAAMLARVAGGHAGGAESWTWLKVGTQWVHFATAGVWAGGLAWLLLALAGRAELDRTAAVRRFSSLALFVILIAGGTGSARALAEVGSVGRLTSTGYGLGVLAKIVLFVGILLLGALNRFRYVKRVAERDRPLRTSVAAEVVIAALVFGVTGAITGLVPPAALSATEPKEPAEIVVSGADFATTMRVRLTVTPGFAGPNRFRADITDFDTRKPVDATSVEMRLSLPSRPDAGTQVVPLTSSGGAWTAENAALSIQGRWRIVVRVQTPTRSAEVALRVDTRLPEQDIAISRQQGQPTLYTITLADGRSVQAYLDPGEKTGANDVHFTFFTAQGAELPVASATMEAAPPEGDAFALDVRRFGPGHFVATVTATRGSWLFRVVARAGEETISAYFRQAIP